MGKFNIAKYPLDKNAYHLNISPLLHNNLHE